MWEDTDSRVAETVLKKKNKESGNILPDTKAYSVATMIKIVCGIGENVDI